jgi:hypothetical protein
MTTLEYVNFTDPPQFICTGQDFKAGTYILEGKFPLEYNDLYENSGIFHTLNGQKVKLIGFTTSCTVGKYSCHITVKPDKLNIAEIIDLNSIAIDLS